MRLFTGLDLPAAVSASLEDLLRHLRPAARLNWSPVANLHVTTKFIGEWPAGRLDELKNALAAVPRPSRLPIAIRGLGWFPNPHQPRVLFAAVDAPPALADLHRATDQALVSLGVPAETKRYSPHLTLARIRETTDLGPVRQRIAQLDSVDFGRFDATGFHLYLSEPQAGGSVYTKLASFPLEPAP
jgi:2'-5' RNA ligase